MNKTRHDFAMLSLVSVPVLCLAGLLVASLLSWNAGAARIETNLRNQYDDDNLSSELPPRNYYYQHLWRRSVSRESSDFIAALGQVQNKYYDLIRVLDDPNVQMSEEDESIYERLLEQFSSDASDLVADLDGVLDEIEANGAASEDKLWLIKTADNSLDGFVRLEFETAAILGDPARTSAALRRYRRIFRIKAQDRMDNNALLNGVRFFRQVSWSIGRGAWDGKQIAAVEEYARPMLDVSNVWTKTIDEKPLTRLEWLRTGKLDEIHRDPAASLIRTAPSERLQWLQNVNQMRSVSTGNLVRLRKNVGKTLEELERSSNSLDTLFQIPIAGQTEVVRIPEMSFHRYADYVAAFENERRFVRTMAALVRYKAQYGEYPDSVSKLRQIGFPQSEMEDFRGRPFTIRKTEVGTYLKNLDRVEKYDVSSWRLSSHQFEIHLEELP